MRKFIFGMILVLLVTSMAMAHDTRPVLHVDTSQDLGPINPHVYGANLSGVVAPRLMPQAQALNLKFLRLGGDPVDKTDLDESTLSLFVYEAKQLGAEPDVSVRLLNGSPEKAAEIVHYANIEKGYNIRYWSIGNEPNFFEAVMKAPSYTVDDLNKNWRAIATAMLAVDPNIILVGPDISQYVVLNADDPTHLQYLEGNLGGDPTDSQGKDWLQEFLHANGDLLGMVSIHRYPYPGQGGSGSATATVDGLRTNSSEWDTIIPNFRKVIHNAAGRDIPIAVTEFNSNSNNSNGGEASLDSVYNAIWVSDVLGRLIRQQVDAVAYWDLQGDPGRSWGLLGEYDVRPTYYAYSMYTHFGSELLKSDWTDPDVSIYAAKRQDGTLTLIVVNLGSDEKSEALKLDGFTPSTDAEVWRMDANHKAEKVDPVTVNDGGMITVPGQSVTLYAIPGA